VRENNISIEGKDCSLIECTAQFRKAKKEDIYKHYYILQEKGMTDYSYLKEWVNSEADIWFFERLVKLDSSLIK
jgi:hypothetical protein